MLVQGHLEDPTMPLKGLRILQKRQSREMDQPDPQSTKMAPQMSGTTGYPAETATSCLAVGVEAHRSDGTVGGQRVVVGGCTLCQQLQT